MKNQFKKLGALLMVVGFAGCSSMGDYAVKQAKTTNSGVIYGIYANPNSTQNIKSLCASINNLDSRCSEPERYFVAPTMSRMAFASGTWGAVAIIDSSKIQVPKSCISGSSSCTYFKVMVEPNKLATVLEVASVPGDGKCKWSGLPRAGGVVCPAYEWDYEKNNQAAVNF